MAKLGKRQMDLTLVQPLAAVPEALARWSPTLEDDGHTLRYVFDAKAENTGIPELLAAVAEQHIAFKDLETRKSSLEDIFVDLVGQRA